MRFKLLRWTRQLLIWLGGYKPSETKFLLFTLKPLLTPEEIWKKLWKHGWGINTLSHTFRHQILTLRKSCGDNQHQYHLRFFDNGRVEGHYEVDPFIFQLEHMDEVDLRALTDEEKDKLWRNLTS